MTFRKRRTTSPVLECLEDRQLQATGISATFSRGVLSIVGTSADVPIVVDVLANRTRRGVSGVVAVEGVGNFRAAQVRQVYITSVTGEMVDINRAPRWNPGFHTNVVSAPVGSNPNPNPTPSPPVLTIPPTNGGSTSTSTPSPVGISSTLTADEQAIVDAVNTIRQQNGLAPLQVNVKLVQMAHLQAGNMATYGVMEHTIPQAAQPGLTDRAGYIGYSYSVLGENIAFNYSDTASVMNGWMNSPPHRANILNPSYTQIGVGIARDSSGQPYYAQVFGKPLS